VLVVRWVDRLGRNYDDVCETIREFMRRGVVIRTVINNMTFDGATQDPVQKAVRDALIAFMAATAQGEPNESPYFGGSIFPSLGLPTASPSLEDHLDGPRVY
jgi:DNA invertase Pin-like site-specific DNA recombinase